MQIREITQQLNENALGAFASGFAQGAGINVPDTGDAGGAGVSAYGDARQKAAAQAAKPMIAQLAKQEMQAWNTSVAELLKQRNLQSPAQLTQSDKQSLRTDLRNRVHKVFMRGKLGDEYNRDFPASVDRRSQTKAKELVNRLNAAIQSITNFKNPAADAAQQLALWQALSQASYDAMSLSQFHPAQSSSTVAGAVSGEMPEILSNPGGGYNIGKLELTRDPVDQLIVQKIQAEQQKNPKARLRPKENTDGSISIGSQRLDPRDPNEAKAIARIKSAAGGPAAPAAPPAAPAAPAAKPTANPASFNAQNIKNLPGMTPPAPGAAAMGNMANQLAKRTAPAESKRR
jgi:hypothetical protein